MFYNVKGLIMDISSFFRVMSHAYKYCSNSVIRSHVIHNCYLMLPALMLILLESFLSSPITLLFKSRNATQGKLKQNENKNCQISL